MVWGDVRYCFAMAILVTSLRLLSGDVLLFYVSFSLLFLFFHTILSARFLGNALIKLYETLQEYHMPCEVVLVRVDFFKMVAVAMETAKMQKIEKHKHDHSRLPAKQKLMKLDRNNIHIQWNKISQKNRNRLDKLCRSCHGNKKGWDLK